MTADVHIRHCRVDARAAPGSTLSWADPEDHRAFAERIRSLVLAMLEELIAPHLADMPEGEVPGALEIALRLDSRDLAGAAPLARAHVRDMVAAAVATALAKASDRGPPEAPDIEPEVEARRLDRAVADRSEAAGNAAASALALLLAWRRERQLEYRFALFSTALLVRLTEAVLAEIGGTEGVAPDPHPAPEGPPPAQDETPIAASEAAVRAGIRQALRALVETAAEAERPSDVARAGRLGHLVASAASALDRALRWMAETGRGREEGSDSGAPAPRIAYEPVIFHPEPAPVEAPLVPSAEVRPELAEEGTPAVPRMADRAGSTSAPRVPQAVDSALPFLAVQRLAAHGVLEASAALNGDAGDGRDALQALAFAAALRCQDSPSDRGRWSEAQLRDAALAAGLPGPLDSAELLAAARAGAEVCEAACGAIGASLIAGHAPGMPLPVLADRGLSVVFESDGFYPLCRLSASRLAEAFAGRAEPFFLAQPDAALVRAFGSAGLLIIASGSPGRGEKLRPAKASGWAGMTNLPASRFAALVPGLAEMEAAGRRASEVWRELTSERPLDGFGAPEATLLDFDRSAALLAGFALADIAWTLSRFDASAWACPDPLLAIERFADLSATVEMAADEVIVHLPLGTRFAHLRDSGLLDTVGAIPWWPGRALAFRGG